MIKICRFCRKEFEPRSNRQVYCDREHRRVCPSCGSIYVEKYNENLSKPPRLCSSYCGIKSKIIPLPQFEIIDQISDKVLINSCSLRSKYENLRISQHISSIGLNPIHVFPTDDINKIANWCNVSKKLDSSEFKVYKLNHEYVQEFLEENDIVPFYKKTSDSLGLVKNSKIYQVMTFARPRYNHKYDYEIIRCCTRNGFNIERGLDTLSSSASIYLGVSSCIAYQDLSKEFNNKYYEKIGMKLHHTNRPRKRSGDVFDCGTNVYAFE